MKLHNINAEIVFDNSGCVYIKKNNDLYEIMISSQNELFCDKICVELKEYVPKRLERLELTHDRTLGGKIEFEKNKSLINQEDENYHLYENIEYAKDKINQDYDEDDEEDKIEFISDDNYQAKIYNFDIDVMIPCYETLLYVDNMMIFKTEILDSLYCYRIKIHKEGDIILRIIGGGEKLYKICEIETDIEIKKIN